ncbi:glycosyltransferase family 2 protein [Heyndrickxia coagulans]|uniref:Glycosyl transferase family 2 n=1 Tax=Heyndrickxia coagulans DSM 1 = ATCC 7050 TaxID=1121088 RepID=A0A8B4BU35_HEYCO|nr:glycosyltransferase family 2 protein [Heyndrickxia coagulans]AJH77830.1 glycosyltransferase like 2 family protein [Heyndrickxia coagulans DSM 1 = ATCC 7050]MED4495541.1 glycosyltransferase family 2 protein [Heyndrickxia coagulans]MED4537553.1 glycosyltransferase family 2 protein [Heyndrickxia coagulans]UYM81742.1 glycosyltransferase [Heyndrickxia coagulans]SHE57457.1 Glycosyl transferase family 2 [Heyndrickxia coagulans DSM 1 = ATCC 7050]
MDEKQLLEKRKAFERQNNIKYNLEGYFVKNKKYFLKTNVYPKVTVVTPVYNAEKNLEKTIKSVINQTIGFENIEYILVDDCSNDNSRKILLEFSEKYSNIVVVFLKKNTGTPAQPRNLGIKLSNADYITFLDADDWLDPNGIKEMYDILEKTGDDYIVGKTIEVNSKGNKIVGEHESCEERRSVSPFSIPHIFQHLGPRARMMRTKLLKENKIRFPEMRFAEDKQFFIDVLINCKAISTTTVPIYYLNRLDENNGSLTKKTDITEKMESNIAVINYVIKKRLDVEKEKMILNRLYEFDSITRLFNRQHFLKSKNKSTYFNIFEEVLKTTQKLRYDFSENFFKPINKAAYELFKEGRYDDIEKLFKWEKGEKVKDVLIKNQLPYVVSPLKDEKYKFIRVSMLAVFQKDYFEGDCYHLIFSVYGDYVDKVKDVLFVDKQNALYQKAYPVDIDENGTAHLVVNMEELKPLPTSSFTIYLRYNGYEKTNIRRINENKITYEGRNYTFYTTVNSNIALKIK